jgi:uncharacterized protein YaeQ
LFTVVKLFETKNHHAISTISIKIYQSQNQSKEISSKDFSVYENEDMQIEFLLEDINEDKRYQVKISPKAEIELVDFVIETKFDYSRKQRCLLQWFSILDRI